MPEFAILERETGLRVSPTTDLDQQLHERAKSLFGYDTGLKTASKEERAKQAKELVYTLLKELNLSMPFTEKSVEEYKHLERIKAQKSGFRGRFRYNWNIKNLSQGMASSYTDPIPEFVLQTACDLKERLPPQYIFGIDVLEVSELARRLDPFLVLIDPEGQRYYLEVWNEPGYKQQRMV